MSPQGSMVKKRKSKCQVAMLLQDLGKSSAHQGAPRAPQHLGWGQTGVQGGWGPG